MSSVIAMPSRTEWLQDKMFMGLSLRDYVKSFLNPTDIVIGLILVTGFPIIAARFMYGLGAVTNLSQSNPWGLWIAFDVACGVALAAGGYTVACAVAIFGLKEYTPIMRPAVLTGMLGYLLVVLGLFVDLGRPWRLPYPLFWSAGTTSVMYELAWCVCLYLVVLIFEFLPAVLEWLGLKELRMKLAKLSIGAIVLGISLSTLHQSSLGSLFLLAPTKLHPLWYSPFLPFFFFVSSISAGIGMVIFESTISHRAFHDQLDPKKPVDIDKLTLGLSKGGALILFSMFFLRLQGVADGGHWNLLATPMGAWFLVEIVGFILVPSLLFACAVRYRNVLMARIAAVMTVLGIVLNRFNVSWLALRWDAPDRYFPTLAEVWVSITIVTIGVALFRWIVNRMPVMYEKPGYEGLH